MNARATLVAIFVAALAACGGPSGPTAGPSRVELPVTDGMNKPSGRTSESRESPPPSGPSKDSPLPAIARSTLGNGMRVAVVPSHALPIVQIRILVRAGSGFASPGVAELTAKMLKDGGTQSMSSAELLRRVATLGADLGVRTGFDGTVLSTAVTKDHLDEALALLSEAIQKPRFDGEELRKLKARRVDEAEDAARSNGTWTATRIVFRDLFPAGSAYATFGLVPSEIARVDVAQIRDFHRRFYVPKAITVFLAGDVDEAAGKAVVERHFGSFRGGNPPSVELPSPHALDKKARVVIAHRPKSEQSDVFVALVAPPRNVADWASVRLANQILGGGVASRLFTDVREQRSLAYRTNAQISELSHGEQPLVLYAGTETSKTKESVVALLENLDRMTSAPPSEAETEGASRYLSDVFAIRMETIGSIADLFVTQDELGLPDGYWDRYRKQLRATHAPEVAAAAKMYQGARMLVVAGDADVIAGELATFGDVTVVDPEKEFKIVRTVPKK